MQRREVKVAAVKQDRNSPYSQDLNLLRVQACPPISFVISSSRKLMARRRKQGLESRGPVTTFLRRLFIDRHWDCSGDFTFRDTSVCFTSET